MSYTLANLAETQLKMQRKEFDAEQVPAMYGSSESLLGLVKHAEEDAWLSLALMFHLSVLPLTRQLTCLSGSLWNKTLQVRVDSLEGRSQASSPVAGGNQLTDASVTVLDEIFC